MVAPLYLVVRKAVHFLDYNFIKRQISNTIPLPLPYELASRPCSADIKHQMSVS